MENFKSTISILLLFCTISLQAQSVGIGTIEPDSSAALDISSATGGLLIPRMSTTDRMDINNPATGLMVFDSTVNSFWCWGGDAWIEIMQGDLVELADADGDTKVVVEENEDEDFIRFYQDGAEYFRMNEGRLEVINTGHSVFIGDGTGMNDDYSDNGNTAIGDSSFVNNTSGVLNTAVGYFSSKSNTTGVQNTSNGAYSLQFNTSGSQNTAMGYLSLRTNTIGSQNTASGYSSLAYNTTGNYNTATGNRSLYSNTTGASNTATGHYSLYKNTTGGYNTTTGYYSLYSNTTGSFNTAMGFNSLRYNTTGYDNTASGKESLFSNTAGYKNTALGVQSLYSNTTGIYNTALGAQSLYSNTTGDYNAALGRQSLYNNTTGNYNTALGRLSLNSNTTGSYNTGIGYSAETSPTVSYSTAIGYQATAVASNVIAIGNSNAKVIIGGAIDPTHKLQINGGLRVMGGITVEEVSYGDYANLQYRTETGKFYYDNSSARFKENIRDLDLNYRAILNARPVQYTRPGEPDRIEIGYIAEEMEALGLDYLIGYDAEGLVENFNYEKMILHVVEVLKDQNKQIDILGDKLIDQQKEIEELKSLVMGFVHTAEIKTGD